MKKRKGLLPVLLSGILSSTFVQADAFTGPRIGIGISDTSISYDGE